MTPRSRVAVMTAVLAVGLGALAGCTSEAAEQDPPDPASAEAVSGPDSEHLLVHGTVTRGGAPLADAEVAVLLEPEDTSDIEVGDVIDLVDVATATTDAEGGYRLEVDPDELSSRYFNGDFLNFQLQIATDDELVIRHTTGHLVRQVFWRSDEPALVGDPALQIDVDLDDELLVTTDSFGNRTEDEAILVPLSS